MVIVGARLVKWHQVPSYYDTVLCNNSRLLHSTVKKKKKKKKWQTRHQVPRCWPHSTVCRSPGHGIWSTWANGDIPMYIWADNRNTGRFLEPPFRSQEPFPLPETEVTSSKMAGGSGNGSWLLNGGSKNHINISDILFDEDMHITCECFPHIFLLYPTIYRIKLVHDFDVFCLIVVLVCLYGTFTEIVQSSFLGT